MRKRLTYLIAGCVLFLGVALLALAAKGGRREVVFRSSVAQDVELILCYEVPSSGVYFNFGDPGGTLSYSFVDPKTPVEKFSPLVEDCYPNPYLGFRLRHESGYTEVVDAARSQFKWKLDERAKVAVPLFE
jgi:hypothetical protein